MYKFDIKTICGGDLGKSYIGKIKILYWKNLFVILSLILNKIEYEINTTSLYLLINQCYMNIYYFYIIINFLLNDYIINNT